MKSSIVRKLGPTETFFAFNHNLASMIVVNAVCLNKTLDVGRLITALDLVKKCHPILSLRTEYVIGKWYFCRGANEPIELVTSKLTSTQTWQQIAQEEVHTPFNIRSRKPLIRCHLIEQESGETVFLLVGSHVILDGLSSVTLMDQVLTAYANPNVEFEKCVLQPALDDLLVQYDVDQNLFPFDQPAEDGDIALTTDQNWSDPALRKSRFMVANIDRRRVDNLIELCRSQQITLNALLNAIALKAIYRNHDYVKPVNLFGGGNGDLRNHCIPPLNNNDIGCYVSMFGFSELVSDSVSLWELAKVIHKKLQGYFSSNITVHTARDYFWESLIQPGAIEKVSCTRQGRFGHLHLSNLGKIHLSENYGDINVEGFHFIAGQHIEGAVYWMGVATLPSRLCLTFTTIDPMTSDKKSMKFVDLVVQEIENLSETLVPPDPC